MPEEPKIKRTFAFFDGQNLFYGAKLAFGYSYPNYAPVRLAESICGVKDWHLLETYFYTGVPASEDNVFWSHFWHAKLQVMGSRGVHTYSRELRYRNQTVPLPGGGTTTILVGQEKGIDIRIALDVVRFARQKAFDVALIFSQDQDLSEMADEVKQISVEQSRWIRLASAFPVSPTYRNTRGINGTEWIKIDRQTYDSCLDPNDYRPRRQ